MLSTASLSFRALVSPKEQGSWSFAFEPVLLGLLVAPSVPGLFLAGAVAHAFFVRRPLKLAFTLPDGDDRRRPALRWAAILTTFTLIGFIGAAMFASRMALCPLLLCVPFGAIFLWFDLRNVAREAPLNCPVAAPSPCSRQHSPRWRDGAFRPPLVSPRSC